MKLKASGVIEADFKIKEGKRKKKKDNSIDTEGAGSIGKRMESGTSIMSPIKKQKPKTRNSFNPYSKRSSKQITMRKKLSKGVTLSTRKAVDSSLESL